MRTNGWRKTSLRVARLLALFLVANGWTRLPEAAASGKQDHGVLAAFDHSAWGRVLKRHVQAGEIDGVPLALVDYGAIAAGDADFDAYLIALASANPQRFSYAAAMAFWINAYNAFAIKLVADHWPVQGIKEIGRKVKGKVWNHKFANVGGKLYSLNDIEHKILRKMGDPRVHAAIVCASVSCPDLRLEPYAAKKLEAQLDEQVRLWLANPGKGVRLEEKKKVLRLSKIFNWFGGDFKKKNGSALDFVILYAPSKKARYLAKHGKQLKIRYLPYNWKLNSLQ